MAFPLSERDRKAADRIVTLTLQYIPYHVEIDLKRRVTNWDSRIHQHYTNYDLLAELRVAHCLVSWDLPEIFPELKTESLVSVHGTLSDQSMTQWKNLPPLMRKEIVLKIYEFMGPV